MRRPIPLIPLLACLLALAAPPAAAPANATDDRIAATCERSPPLQDRFTKAELRHAQRTLPADTLEYSGCYDAIIAALRASTSGAGPGGGGDSGNGGLGSGAGGSGIGGTSGSGGGGPSGGGGAPGAPPANPHTGTEAPVAIAGTAVQPGELPSIGQDANELPRSLVVLLALLGAAALVAVALTIGRRVVARRGA